MTKRANATSVNIGSPRVRWSQVVEDARIELVARRLRVVRELRPDAGGDEAAEDVAVLIDALAAIHEKILHADRIAFHTGYLGDAGDLARTVTEPRRLDDDVDRRRDLLAHGACWEIEPGHLHHHLEPIERVARRVGVDRRNGAVVAGVHRLEHV